MNLLGGTIQGDNKAGGRQMDSLHDTVWQLQHPDNEMSTSEKLAELVEVLEQDEDSEVSILCLECNYVFAAGADHLMGLDGCPLCGSEDLEVV